MNDVEISIKLESVIKVEPEMMRLPDAFESLKEERDADGEDSFLASSSDETSTETGSNLNVVACTPLLPTVANEDSGHEGSPDDHVNVVKNKGAKGGRGRAYSLNKESDEVCIIEERICENHWRNPKGHVARDCCSWHFRCSICGTSILRRRDFAQHVQEHMAERQMDGLQFHMKRSHVVRSVRPSHDTETARKESAGKMPPKPLARLQSRTTPAVERRKRGRSRSVHLDDDGDSEMVETDARIAPKTLVPPRGNVGEDTVPAPRAGQDVLDILGSRKLILAIKRLPLHILEKAGIPILRSAESEKTNDQELGKKQSQSHKQTHAGRPSRKPDAKCGSACNADAVNEVSSKTGQSDAGGRNMKKRLDTVCTTSNKRVAKTKQLQSQKELVVRTRIFQKPIASGRAPNKEVEEIVSNPRSNKDTHAGSVQKACTMGCTTAITEANKELLSKPNPQSQVQVDDGRLPLRKSETLESASNRAETINVSSETPLQSHVQPEGCSSQKELAAKGRSSNVEASEKVLTKTPDRSHAHNASGKHTLPQTHKDYSAVFCSEIDINRLPRLFVRVEPEATLYLEESEANDNLKDAKTKEVSKTQGHSPAFTAVTECTIDKPQSPFSGSAEVRTRSQRARKSESEGISEGMMASVETPSAAPFQSQIQKLRAFRKPRHHTGIISNQATDGQASMNPRFQSRRRTLGNHEPEQVATEERTPKKHSGDSCPFTNAGDHEKQLAKARLESDISKRTFPEQTSHVEGSGEEKEEASSKTPLQLQTESVGVHATRKRRAGSTQNGEFHKMADAKERACSIQTRKSAVILNNAADNEVPPKTQRQSRARSASGNRKYQVCCNSAAVIADSQAKPMGTTLELHLQPGIGDHVFTAQKSHATEGEKETAQRQSRVRSASGNRKYQVCCNSTAVIADSQANPMGTTLKSHLQPGIGDHVLTAQKSHATEGEKETAYRLTFPKTRLQSHMQADEANGTFRCSYCKATFPNVDSLRPHVESHRYWEESFYCELCQRRFSTRGYLAMHMNAHQRGKPFACDQCDRRFALRSYLAMHMRGHAQAAGEKPLACSVCGARFVRVHFLNAHLRSHKGVRGRASAAAEDSNRARKTH